MFVPILILCLIIVLVLISYMLYKKSGLAFLKKSYSSTPLFLTGEDTVNFFTEKAKLTQEETDALQTLFSVSGTPSRVHTAFEDDQVARKWFINTKRSLFHNENMDKEQKEQLEYFLYEIYRKLTNERNKAFPSITSFKDIASGQSMQLKSTDGSIFNVEFDALEGKTLYCFFTDTEHSFEESNLLKKKVTVSLWKKFDSAYYFTAEIVQIVSKKNNKIIVLKNLGKITRGQIRLYPRHECEIPVRVRQATMSTDPDTGALIEDFGQPILGLMNDIGPKGCSIVSYFPIVVDTLVHLEFPLYNRSISITGIVRRVVRYRDSYVMNIEFKTVSQQDILMIYHFIYADV